jgi:hypothetical protein
MTGPDTRVERSVAFWLRAYPRRWRATRAAELEVIAADLTTPGTTRLHPRAVARLVAAGWATRWRSRPPLRDYLLYVGFDRRIPAPYRAWAADDLDGPLAPLRIGLRGPVAAILTLSFLQRRWDLPTDLVVVGAFLALFVASWLALGGRRLEALRRKHLVPQLGEPLVPGTRVFEWVPRDRVTATAGALTGLLCTAVAGVVAAAAWVLAPRGVAFVGCPAEPGAVCSQTVSRLRDGIGPVGLVMLGVAVVVGVVGARVAAGRLRRTVPLRPVQVARRLVGLGVRRAAATVVAGVLLLADLVAEGTGRIDLWAAPVVAVVAAALLPAAVVLWRCASRGPTDLSWSDVRGIAGTGRVPVLDEFATGLVPFPVDAGAHPAAGGARASATAVADDAEGPRSDWLH